MKTATMSSYMTNGKYWTTDCIRHPKRRLCVCCPNGVHIDVDFDVFYKTLTKMQKCEETTTTATKEYKHFKRKQDPTMDALLGYHTQPSVANGDEVVYKSRDMPAKASPDVQESLEQALHDFEETLIRSSTSDVRSPLMSPLLTNHFSSSLSLRSDTKSECLNRLVNGDKNGDVEPIATPTEFVEIAAPTKFREVLTPTEFKEISTSTGEVVTPTEFREIATSTREVVTPTEFREIAPPIKFRETTTPTEFREVPKKTLKNVGINCSVITRDVGTICTPVRYHEVGINTLRNTKDAETTTESHIDTKFSLNQILQPKSATVGTQTILKITPLEIIERRDRSVQTDVSELRPKECKLDSIYELTRKRSVATSTDTLNRAEWRPMVQNTITYSKYCQTRDVVVKERVLLKKVGCQTDVSAHKYKDVGINTVRKKMVDASTGESTAMLDTICEKCQNMKTSLVSNQSVSKIPRPKHIQVNAHSNKKKLLMRQDTYVTIPSPELEKLKELQKMESPVSCDNKISTEPTPSTPTTFHPSELCSDQSFFLPISDNKVKAQPSKEMKAAMKVFNDSLKKPSFPKLKATSLRSAISIIQEEWFKVSSLSTADPLTVEDYLDAFEEVSTNLLEFIVNMRDGAGNTAMHYAVSHGNFDVVSILLDSKVCDINVVNDAGYTCIMLVSLAQIKSDTHCDVIRRLFSMADVNLKATQHGQTTMMLAASHGKLDVMKLLLECGADVNIQDDDGSTALMCAAEHGYLDIVNLLAEHPDCDLTIKDNDGSTALTIAMENNHREIGIALYTRQHFADLNRSNSKEKRSRSANPILIEHRTRTPSLKSAPSSPSTLA